MPLTLVLLILAVVAFVFFKINNARKQEAIQKFMFGDVASEVESLKRGAASHPFNKIAFVYNPASGKGRGAKIFDQLKPLLTAAFGNKIFKFVATEGADGATEKTRQLVESGCDLIVACGGDGTVHEVTNGIMDPISLKARCAMAVIPMGTGDDFAKTLGFVKKEQHGYLPNFPMIVRTIQNAKLTHADVGYLESTDEVNETKKVKKFFINECSIGVGGEVMKAINSKTSFWISKDASFQFESIKQQFLYKNKHIKLKFDNRAEQEQVCQLIAFANGKFFGSGMMIAPTAKIDDGKLETTSFGDVSAVDMVFHIIPKIYEARHGEHPKVSFDSCKNCEISLKDTNDHMYIEADGELSGKLPAKVSTLVGALPMIVA